MIYFFDTERGSDVTGNGTKEKPYKTAKAAWRKVAMGDIAVNLAVSPSRTLYQNTTLEALRQENLKLRDDLRDKESTIIAQGVAIKKLDEKIKELEKKLEQANINTAVSE